MLLILIRWLTLPTAHETVLNLTHSYGAKFGLFVGLILAAIQTAFGLVLMRAAGTTLPWQARQRRL